MSHSRRITPKHILIAVLLAAVMLVAYFAGTISVEAKWWAPAENRATQNQISAVSAAVSLLLFGDKPDETIFLPLITK